MPDDILWNQEIAVLKEQLEEAERRLREQTTRVQQLKKETATPRKRFWRNFWLGLKSPIDDPADSLEWQEDRETGQCRTVKLLRTAHQELTTPPVLPCESLENLAEIEESIASGLGTLKTALAEDRDPLEDIAGDLGKLLIGAAGLEDEVGSAEWVKDLRIYRRAADIRQLQEIRRRLLPELLKHARTLDQTDLALQVAKRKRTLERIPVVKPKTLTGHSGPLVFEDPFQAERRFQEDLIDALETIASKTPTQSTTLTDSQEQAAETALRARIEKVRSTVSSAAQWAALEQQLAREYPGQSVTIIRLVRQEIDRLKVEE